MFKILLTILLVLIIAIAVFSLFFSIIECIEKIRDFIHFKKMKGHYVIRWIHRDTDGKFRYMSYVSDIRESGISGGQLKRALIFKNAQDALNAVVKNKYDNDLVIIKL